MICRSTETEAAISIRPDPDGNNYYWSISTARIQKKNGAT